MSSSTLVALEERYMTLFKEAQGGNPLRSPSIGGTSTTGYLGGLQDAIDKERFSLGLPLRFHTEAEMPFLIAGAGEQRALDPYELEDELAELETNYKNAPDPPVQANLQIQIDRKLLELGRSTRYYTKAELDGILGTDNKWPSVPRAPLSDLARLFSAPPALRGPPALLAAASGLQVATGLTSGLGPVRAAAAPPAEPQTVKVNGRTTLTLDAVIQRLSMLRSRLSGSTPVWSTQMGSISSLRSIGEWEGGVVLDG